MNDTSLSCMFSVKHKSLTSPSENCALPAPMMLILTDFAMRPPRSVCYDPAQRQLVRAMTAHEPIGTQLAQHRRLRFAAIDRIRTPWMKIATAGWIGRVRHFAAQRHLPTGRG